MTKRLMPLILRLMVPLIALLAGCVQVPTEKQAVSDMRPSLSFRSEGARAQGARVLIDNLDMGSIDEYQEGTAALRLLPGTHLVRVVAAGNVLLEEKLYVSDGVNRTLLVK
jgi:hypothetical protein